ncbi:MAG: hypothetical protein P1P89_04400 [Desulfobacterales bacterium]|nr:hypothetical protein [Desulfobacterales bacterium]
MPTHHASTDNQRYYQIGGMTICVESDIAITEKTFHPKFKHFQCNGPGEDTVFIRHHFFIPDLDGWRLGKKVYQKPPWAIYRKEDAWIYLGVYNGNQTKNLHRLAVFTPDHTEADIYHHPETKNIFQKGGIASLSLLPTDQIILARVLADRQGCILHSGGVIFENNGLLFVGHSDAGKSTMVILLKQAAEILCDDRIILRHQPAGYHIYGTWSHGDVPQISPASAPLKAILFLKQARSNQVIHLDNQQEVIRRLLACLIKPLATADWWNSMLTIVPQIAAAVPCYTLEFDRSGQVVELLRDI